MTAPSADTVLVVGATGHVGSQVARELARTGRPVRALVRSPDRMIADTAGLPIEYVVGDLTDEDSIDRAVAGVGAIVSTANGIIPAGRTATPRAMNDLVGDVLVDAAIRHDVERFVQSSVPTDGWGDRHVPELAGKRAVERVLESSPLGYTIVRNPTFTDVWMVMCGALQAANDDPHATTARPFGFMRTWQRLTGNLVVGRGCLLAPGGPDHGSAFVTTRDVALAMAAAIDSPTTERATLEFGGPEWLSWREVADLFEQRLGRRVRTTAMPAWFSNAGRVSTKPFAPAASNVLALVTFVARHQPRWVSGPTVELLGLPPQTSVAEYLDRHLTV